MRPAVAREGRSSHRGLARLQPGPPAPSGRILRPSYFGAGVCANLRGRPLHAGRRRRDPRALGVVVGGSDSREQGDFRRVCRASRSTCPRSRGDRCRHLARPHEPGDQFHGRQQASCVAPVRAQSRRSVGERTSRSGGLFSSLRSAPSGSLSVRDCLNGRYGHVPDGRSLGRGTCGCSVERGSATCRHPSRLFVGWRAVGPWEWNFRALDESVRMARVHARAVSRSLARRARSASLTVPSPRLDSTLCPHRGCGLA